MKVINSIDKYLKIFTNILSGVAGIMMAILTAIVFAEVLCRYVFKTPIVITTEVINILFPWIVMLSAISIAKNNGNTALVFIKEKFKGVQRHVIEITVQLVILYFSFLFTIRTKPMPILNVLYISLSSTPRLCIYLNIG